MNSIIKKKPLNINLYEIYDKLLLSSIYNFTLRYDNLTFFNCKQLIKKKVFLRTRIVKKNYLYELKLNKNINCSIDIYKEEILAILANFIIPISEEEFNFNNINIISIKNFIDLYGERISEYQPFIGVKINNIEYFGFSNFLINALKNNLNNLNNVNEITNSLKIQFIESHEKIYSETFFYTFTYFYSDDKEWINNNKDENLLFSLNCQEEEEND